MPQNTSQQPDKSAAALAFATMLSEQLLKQQNSMQMGDKSMQEEIPMESPERSQTLETAPGEEETPEMGNMPMEEELDLEMEEEMPEEESEEEPEEHKDMKKDMKAEMEKMVDEKMSKMEERMDKMMVEMMSKMNEKRSEHGENE